jgi:hypothetical protein
VETGRASGWPMVRSMGRARGGLSGVFVLAEDLIQLRNLRINL